MKLKLEGQLAQTEGERHRMEEHWEEKVIVELISSRTTSVDGGIFLNASLFLVL